MNEGKKPRSASAAVSRQQLGEVLGIRPGQYISRTRIAEVLGVDIRQLSVMEQRDDWPPGTLIGRRVKYLGADVLDWLVEHADRS